MQLIIPTYEGLADKDIHTYATCLAQTTINISYHCCSMLQLHLEYTVLLNQELGLAVCKSKKKKATRINEKDRMHFAFLLRLIYIALGRKDKNRKALSQCINYKTV